MADVTLKYKGATISELSESGSKTIETAGKYCEADILLEYVKPEGGAVEQTYTTTLASTLGSELWNLYVAPLISSYPACATVSVTNYDTSDTLSITSGVLCKRTSSDNGWGNVTRVGSDRAGTDLSSIGAHLAVGAVLSVKAYAFL